MAHDKELLLALGRVTVGFQSLESQIAFITGLLISEDQRVGQIITASMSFSRLCDVCMSLLRHKTDDAELLSLAEKAIARASELEQTRNKLVHSMWGYGSKNVPHRIKHKIDRKSGHHVAIEPTLAKDVDRVADAMEKINAELLKLLIKMAQCRKDEESDGNE